MAGKLLKWKDYYRLTKAIANDLPESLEDVWWWLGCLLLLNTSIARFWWRIIPQFPPEAGIIPDLEALTRETGVILSNVRGRLPKPREEYRI